MRLDNDFYCFTMGQLIWRCYPEIEVEYAFTNRTDVNLLDHIDPEKLQLKLQDIYSDLISLDEIAYLKSLNIFDENYLEWLYNSLLPEISVFADDGQLEISYRSDWATGVFLEPPILATINEMYSDSISDDIKDWKFGDKVLETKLDYLQQHSIIFSEFGTRRRRSFDWQAHVIKSCIDRLGMQIVGSSNMKMCQLYGLSPRGTMAHQLFMVASAIHQDPLKGQLEVLELWEREWGGKWDDNLLIALPDTYGTDFFLKHFSPEMARRWKGFRQDSGDPFEFGGKILGFYHALGINPKEKLLIFSDGLDIAQMKEIYSAFGHKINVSFGWGTNLTNDVGNKPLSIVIKPIDANGEPCCKLSDNINKATGNRSVIGAYKEAVDYRTTYKQEVRY